jgi:vesicle-associated membrane protein 7
MPTLITLSIEKQHRYVNLSQTTQHKTMILYALVARSKDGAILAEQTIAGVSGGNFPQISIEVLQKVVSTSNYTSAVLGTLETTASTEMLPNGSRRTFVQRHGDTGFFSGLATQWSCFYGNNNDDSNSSNNNNNAQNNGELDYYFHMYRHEDIITLCISDDTDARYHTVNFSFLDDLDEDFTKNYSAYKITKAKAYEFDKKFKIPLGKLLHFYNENRSKMVRQGKVAEYIQRVDDVKDILGRNITLVMDRGESLDELMQKSDDMLQDVQVFSKRSSQLKRRVQAEYYSYQCLAVVFIVLVLYLAVGSLCGYGFQCLAS